MNEEQNEEQATMEEYGKVTVRVKSGFLKIIGGDYRIEMNGLIRLSQNHLYQERNYINYLKKSNHDKKNTTR